MYGDRNILLMRDHLSNVLKETCLPDESSFAVSAISRENRVMVGKGTRISRIRISEFVCAFQVNSSTFRQWFAGFQVHFCSCGTFVHAAARVPGFPVGCTKTTHLASLGTLYIYAHICTCTHYRCTERVRVMRVVPIEIHV